jgi:multidrug resistance efflux pump
MNARITKRLLPVLILTLGIAGFLVLKATRPVPPPAEPRERIWQVEALTITPTRHVPHLTLYGRVEAPGLFHAAAPSAARVEKVHVQDGQSVRAGNLLLTLDPRDFEPRLRQAEADVAELVAQRDAELNRAASDRKALENEKALLELARSGLRRAESLLARNLGAQAQYDDAREAVERQTLSLTSREQAITDHPARLAQIEARLARAKATLDIARRDLERSRIHAPFDGVVATLDTSEGAQVAASQTLLSVYPDGGLELRAKLPTSHVDELLASL